MTGLMFVVDKLGDALAHAEQVIAQRDAAIVDLTAQLAAARAEVEAARTGD